MAPRARWLVAIAAAILALLLALPAMGQPAPGDGAPITPGVAEALFDRVKTLGEPDGCRVAGFDTSRFRIHVLLRTPAGGSRGLDLATTLGEADAGQPASVWSVSAPADVRGDCPATVAALEQVLRASRAPAAPTAESSGRVGESIRPRAYPLLTVSFVLLVLGTVRLLLREARRRRPPALAVACLLLVWGVGLALRLELSPHTFLHEYFHIAETVKAYLDGEMAPAYGNGGPALVRLVGALLGRPDDYRTIFLTNTVVSSLAIPAVALLDRALTRSWPRAICGAVLVCVLPQHLRLSGAEDLFVQAVTWAIWSLAIFAVYLRTRRLADALLATLGLSVAMQTRPEMLFLPAVVLGLAWLVSRRSRRLLLAWQTLLAAALLVALLVPRAIDLSRAVTDRSSPSPSVPGLEYLRLLVLLRHDVTPVAYWVLLAAGLVWGFMRAPWLVQWAAGVFFGYTLLSQALFSNPAYALRSQLLPMVFVCLVAAGAAPLWMGIWGRRRRVGLALGASGLAALGALVVLGSRSFVTALFDQQVEWAFLERTVPGLPQRGTLLSPTEPGGRDLDTFPTFLLAMSHLRYETIDLRRAARGEERWPDPDPDLLYYQGLFCYFAFEDEPSPDPMTAPCRAVHERYSLEPLSTYELRAAPYSQLRYAGGGGGPYTIGFYRLRGPAR